MRDRISVENLEVMGLKDLPSDVSLILGASSRPELLELRVRARGVML